MTMKLSEEAVRNWVNIISSDVGNLSEEDKEYVTKYGKYLDVEELPAQSGIIAYSIIKDFDCKKKMSVVILYCKPECRGKYLTYMFRRIEEIAKQESAVKVVIGDSVSGYKENKFNRMLEYYGYRACGHYKEITNG